MPQPDLLLFIPRTFGGQAIVDADDYVEGGPEFVAEVAASSASYDLHEKLHVYRRHGVKEYVVWRTFDGAIDYFILRQGEYLRHAADEQGRFRSEVFPGLWLDVPSLLKGDLAVALKFVQEGIASLEHAAFAAELQKRAASK